MTRGGGKGGKKGGKSPNKPAPLGKRITRQNTGEFTREELDQIKNYYQFLPDNWDEFDDEEKYEYLRGGYHLPEEWLEWSPERRQRWGDLRSLDMIFPPGSFALFEDQVLICRAELLDYCSQVKDPG